MLRILPILAINLPLVFGTSGTLAPSGGTMQMSERWDEMVLEKLNQNGEAYKALSAARDSGTLVKGAAYVDKTTGKLNLVRINPITRKK